jgi:hypothetical protein
MLLQMPKSLPAGYRDTTGDLPMDENKSLYAHQMEILGLVTAIMADYHRLLLYFPVENPIIEVGRRCTESILNIRKVFKKHMNSVRIAARDEEQAFKSRNDATYKKAVSDADEIMKQYRVEMSPAVENAWADFGEFISTLNNHFTAGSKKPESLPLPAHDADTRS